ncbi:MAG TPA: hypothetical protein VKZ58_00490 [Longimicrobiales bacterium]|nr:hypothetical protein [Longimicrobiales bacterium]
MTAGAAFYSISHAPGSPRGRDVRGWSGLGTTLVTVIALVVHGQGLDPSGPIGIGPIVAGVVVLRLFSGASVGESMVIRC